MRKIYRIILWSMVSFSALGQNKPVLYDFTGIPQSLLLNPGAEVDNRWYTGIPLLSGVRASFGSDGFSVYDLFADNEVSFNDKVRDLLFRLSSRDAVMVNQQLEIFNIGFKNNWKGRYYYSFGMYQEADAFMYWPKDLAILAHEGNRDYLGKRFNFGHLNASAEMLTVLHFGVRKKVSERLYVGARAKLYSGMINFNSTDNSGYFVTETGEENFYRHRVVSDAVLHTSGYVSLREIEEDGNQVKNGWKELRSRALFSGNMGLGLDFGFTYHPAKQWTVTGSLQDLGFIRYTEDVESYSLKGSYELEGIELIFPSIIDGSGEVRDYWEDLRNDIEEQLPYDTLHNKYTLMRPWKLNGSVRYSFGIRRNKKRYYLTDYENYVNTVGAQFFIVNRPRGPLPSVTGFFSRKLMKSLEVKVTYTADKFSQTNIGAGLSAYMKNVHFYLLADNIPGLFDLAKTHYASLQFGFNYVFPHSGEPY
ncbi:hypothetical protein ED312_12265 [Sinomicrobium pectinilyticum]|uniref:DUF5723 domain-containing protein n=1 Tax=Sinomicrobium pectinilyticum TaxID=1084421 RepID=A0A3N0ECS7_SINP1|nr:DUF5723 family protein [Sinomicrobium pectinilyticum]RNL85634.1 hypothetical protein ED312_12265 [Sinomicrobium pectinilyticum]